MKFSSLPWDSQFFHVRVGKLELDPSDSATAAIEFLRNNSGDLTYVFTPEAPSPGLPDALAEAGATLVDVKTIYRKDASLPQEQSRIAEINLMDRITPELIRLSAKSGWCSRFFRDLRLRPYFDELYRRWLENCHADPHGCVWGCICDNRLAGMACAIVSDERIGRLGLIAVDDAFQGRGIGKALMEKAEEFYRGHGAAEYEVVTQQANAGACCLYERCGYSVKQRIPIWHYWK